MEEESDSFLSTTFRNASLYVLSDTADAAALRHCTPTETLAPGATPTSFLTETTSASALHAISGSASSDGANVPFVALLLISALLSFIAVCILLWRSSSNASMQLIITMGFATCLNCFSFFMTGLFHGFHLDRKEAAVWFSWMQGSLITFTEVIIFLMGCAISHLIYERGVLLKGWNKFLKGDESKKRVKFMIIAAIAAAVLFTGLESAVIYSTGHSPLGLFSIRPDPPWAKSISASLYCIATVFVCYRSLQILRSQIAASRELAKLTANHDYLDKTEVPSLHSGKRMSLDFTLASSAGTVDGGPLPSLGGPRPRRYSSDNHSFVSLPWSKGFHFGGSGGNGNGGGGDHGGGKRTSVASVSSMTSTGSTTLLSTMYLRLLVATILYALYGALIATTTLAYVMTSFHRKKPNGYMGISEHILANEVGPREYATSAIGIIFFLVFATTADARKAYIPAWVEDQFVATVESCRKGWHRQRQRCGHFFWRLCHPREARRQVQDEESGSSHLSSSSFASSQQQHRYQQQQQRQQRFGGSSPHGPPRSISSEHGVDSAASILSGHHHAGQTAGSGGQHGGSAEIKWRNSVYSDLSTSGGGGGSAALHPLHHASHPYYGGHHHEDDAATRQMHADGIRTSPSLTAISAPGYGETSGIGMSTGSGSNNSSHGNSGHSPPLPLEENVAGASFHVGDELDFLDPAFFKKQYLAAQAPSHPHRAAPGWPLHHHHHHHHRMSGHAHSDSADETGGVTSGVVAPLVPPPRKPQLPGSKLNGSLSTASIPLYPHHHLQQQIQESNEGSSDANITADKPPFVSGTEGVFSSTTLPAASPKPSGGGSSLRAFSNPALSAVFAKEELAGHYLHHHGGFPSYKYGLGRRGSDTPIADPMALHPNSLATSPKLIHSGSLYHLATISAAAAAAASGNAHTSHYHNRSLSLNTFIKPPPQRRTSLLYKGAPPALVRDHRRTSSPSSMASPLLLTRR